MRSSVLPGADARLLSALRVVRSSRYAHIPVVEVVLNQNLHLRSHNVLVISSRSTSSFSRTSPLSASSGARTLVRGSFSCDFERELTLSHSAKGPKRFAEVWQELLALLASGKLKPILFKGEYTLDTLAKGLDDLEHRRTWGKAVVRVREPPAQGKL